jgi:hypothetical protein
LATVVPLLFLAGCTSPRPLHDDMESACIAYIEPYHEGSGWTLNLSWERWVHEAPRLASFIANNSQLADGQAVAVERSCDDPLTQEFPHLAGLFEETPGSRATTMDLPNAEEDLVFYHFLIDGEGGLWLFKLNMGFDGEVQN